MQLVQAAPRSAAAGDGLVWVVQNRARLEELDVALGLLTKHHLRHHNIATACSSLSHEFGASVESFLRAAYDKNGPGKAKAAARYTLAKVLLRRAEYSDLVRQQAFVESIANPKMADQISRAFGAHAVAFLQGSDSAALRGEAEKYLDALAEQAGDYAGSAAKDLFEIRNLTVGKIAPEIAGEDVDGTAFKLSDYRGKVILLDFWGDW